jgi:hypothetical protein
MQLLYLIQDCFQLHNHEQLYPSSNCGFHTKPWQEKPMSQNETSGQTTTFFPGSDSATSSSNALPDQHFFHRIITLVVYLKFKKCWAVELKSLLVLVMSLPMLLCLR